MEYNYQSAFRVINECYFVTGSVLYAHLAITSNYFNMQGPHQRSAAQVVKIVHEYKPLNTSLRLNKCDLHESVIEE